MKKAMVLAAVMLLALATSGWAVCGPIDDWIEEKAASDTYAVKVGGMLLQGVHLIVESPYELGYHIYDEVKSDPALGLFKGLGVGGGRMLGNIGVGALNLVTAVVPGLHGPEWPHDHVLFGGGSSATA